jgi:hypothetical protein
MARSGLWAFLHAFVVPIAIFISVTWVGTMQDCYTGHLCAKKCPCPGGAAVPINTCIKLFGDFVVLPFLLCRWLIVGCETMENEEIVNSHTRCLTVVVWLVIVLLRAYLYIRWMDPTNAFSDHIFLLSSILPLCSMELFLLHTAYAQRKTHVHLMPLILTWILIAACCSEAFVTSSFYHTAVSSRYSLGIGVPLFYSIAVLWMISITHPDTKWLCYDPNPSKVQARERKSTDCLEDKLIDAEVIQA